MINFLSKSENGTRMAYGNVDLQQTAEDIRILKRHVDELNELFVSGQAAEDERMEQRGCAKAKRNNMKQLHLGGTEKKGKRRNMGNPEKFTENLNEYPNSVGPKV
jgi:hypothetical protein